MPASIITIAHMTGIKAMLVLAVTLVLVVLVVDIMTQAGGFKNSRDL